MRYLDDTIKQMTDREIEKRLEQLTFIIAIETTHVNAFSDHKRHAIQKDLLVNKQNIRVLRRERERRIIAGEYRPF